MSPRLARIACPGSGLPAVAHHGSVYPHCPTCDREMAAQGRKAQQRYQGAWASVPSHYAMAGES